MLRAFGLPGGPIPSARPTCNSRNAIARGETISARPCKLLGTVVSPPASSALAQVIRAQRGHNPQLTIPKAARRGTAPKDDALRKAIKRASRQLQEEVKPTLTGPPFVASPEQQRAIDLVLAGRNVFLTGCAGTGKSATLLELRSRLQRKHGSKEEFHKRVAVVAMTGLAATIVGGVTLHSLLKLGLAKTFGDFDRMIRDEELLALLLELRTLVLDEAGMMSAELLQALDHYLTVARKAAAERNMAKDVTEEARQRLLAPYNKPFGGLQLIVSGDFFQLAPIEGRLDLAPRDNHTPQSHHSKESPAAQPFRNRGFMFEAPAFHYGGFAVVELTQVFRQEEEGFVALLNSVRCGSEQQSRQALEQLLATCSRPLEEQDDIKPTLLFSRNDDVAARNELEMGNLAGPPRSFTSVDTLHVTQEPPGSLYAPLVREGLLTQDALDALVRDLDSAEMVQGLHEARLKRLGQGAAARAQQLRKEWRDRALKHLREVAKSGGGLFRECQAAETVDLKEAAQVMLVRNMDLESNLANGSRGVVEGFAELDMETVKRCLAMAQKAEVQQILTPGGPEVQGCDAEMKKWLKNNPRVPLVKFTDGQVAPVLPAVFTALVPGYGVCVRVQMPLKLAWAITVHKSQGMTLDRVSINLNRFFGHGMLYTALSRAKGTAGMHLEGSSNRRMDPRVLRWWDIFRSDRRYIPERPPPDRPWCWQDTRQPYLGRPQNPHAELWFKQGPEAFFAWWDEEVVLLEAEAEARRRQEQEEERRRRQEEEQQQEERRRRQEQEQRPAAALGAAAAQQQEVEPSLGALRLPTLLPPRSKPREEVALLSGSSSTAAADAGAGTSARTAGQARAGADDDEEKGSVRSSSGGGSGITDRTALVPSEAVRNGGSGGGGGHTRLAPAISKLQSTSEQLSSLVSRSGAVKKAELRALQKEYEAVMRMLKAAQEQE